jgi:hypothetical protein
MVLDAAQDKQSFCFKRNSSANSPPVWKERWTQDTSE